MMSNSHHHGKCGDCKMKLMLVEHINLNIMDIDSARIFFEQGLGCVENPLGRA